MSIQEFNLLMQENGAIRRDLDSMEQEKRGLSKQVFDLIEEKRRMGEESEFQASVILGKDQEIRELKAKIETLELLKSKHEDQLRSLDTELSSTSTLREEVNERNRRIDGSGSGSPSSLRPSINASLIRGDLIAIRAPTLVRGTLGRLSPRASR